MPPWDLAQTHPLDGPGQWVGVAAAQDGAHCSAEASRPHSSSHSQAWKMFLDHLISNGKPDLNCKYSSDLAMISFVTA